MPVLYLVRHGQASFGSDNYDKLSELGVRQAEIVGRALRQREVRHPVLISGTLSRQQDTARAVGASLGVHELTVDPGWDELDAHGIVDAALGAPGASSALTSQEFQVVLDRVLMQQITDRDADWVSFESAVLGALDNASSAIPAGSDAVVATSAGVTAAIVGHLLGTDAAGIVQAQRVSVNASITVVACSPRGKSLLSFNDFAHLAGDRSLVSNR